jgi:hypothetical protein
MQESRQGLPGRCDCFHAEKRRGEQLRRAPSTQRRFEWTDRWLAGTRVRQRTSEGLVLVRVLVVAFSVACFFAFLDAARVGDAHRAQRIVHHAVVRVWIFFDEAAGLIMSGFQLLIHAIVSQSGRMREPPPPLAHRCRTRRHARANAHRSRPAGPSPSPLEDGETQSSRVFRL